MVNVDCNLIDSFLTVLWAVIAAAIVGPIAFILGRRSHPFERANRQREFTYKGPGGGK